MAFNVRIYGYRGTSQLPSVQQKQMQADSVQVLVQPYEFAQVLATNGATAVSSAADPSTKVTILRVEVPDAQSIRYEINPPGRSVAAGNQSPILSGRDQFFFGTGWTISIVEASSFP